MSKPRLSGKLDLTGMQLVVVQYDDGFVAEIPAQDIVVTADALHQLHLARCHNKEHSRCL